MAKRPAALAAFPDIDDLDAPPRSADVLALDAVAERRARLLANAAASAAVVVYEFAIPNGALVDAAGGGERRDAKAQLELVVARTGGSVGKHPGGLAARVPQAVAGRFEALAAPLIEAFLIGWRA